MDCHSADDGIGHHQQKAAARSSAERPKFTYFLHQDHPATIPSVIMTLFRRPAFIDASRGLAEQSVNQKMLMRIYFWRRMHLD